MTATRTASIIPITWDDKELLITPGGEVKYPRATGLLAHYCAESDRRTDLDWPESMRCDNYTMCEECWLNWSPNMGVQGTPEQWANTQVSSLTRELDRLRDQIEHELISKERVAEVSLKYAIDNDLCGVYEECLTELGIDPIQPTSDITVTVTLNMTVQAGRRQRRDDVNWMRQSVVHSTISEALSDVDIFDYDFELVSSVDVTSVDVELQ